MRVGRWGEVSLIPSPRVMQRNWRIGEWDCVTECVYERGEKESREPSGTGEQWSTESERELKIEEWIRWDSLGFCHFGQTVHFAPFFFFWILAWISQFGTSMACFGQYGPIQRKLVRFSASRPKLARIRAYREPEKKKKGHGTDAQAAALPTAPWVGCGFGGHFAASVHNRCWFWWNFFYISKCKVLYVTQKKNRTKAPL